MECLAQGSDWRLGGATTHTGPWTQASVPSSATKLHQQQAPIQLIALKTLQDDNPSV